MQSDPYAPADALKHAADKGEFKGVQVDNQAVSIRAPRDELYAFIRDFANAPRFMENVERVEDRGGGRSHWIARRSGDHTVEWDAVMTEDVPGERFAWSTEPDADVQMTGSMELRDAPHGRGVEVHATNTFKAPGGDLGKAVMKLFQQEPGQQAKRNLRRLKMLLETGEIATTDYPDAAPRYKKSDATPEARQAETR